MEAVCRSLVEYNIRVRDLGQLFVTCPALLMCRAEDIHQRVSTRVSTVVIVARTDV